MAVLIRINGEQYRIPLTVSDITLSTQILLMQVEKTAPQEFLDIMNEKDDELRAVKAKRIPKRTYASKVLPYFARVIEAATGIPADILLGKNGHAGAPVHLIEDYFWKVQAALLSFDETQAKDRFEIGGEVWTLPKQHMKGGTFGEFAEAATYEDEAASVAAGSWERMAYVMAVLLRPEGEKFDPATFEEIVEERAAFMLTLGMDVVYSTAFFLLKQNQKSNVDMAIYSTAQALGRYRQGARP